MSGPQQLQTPLQLVREVNGRYEVPDETAAAIAELQAGGFCVLSVAGRYRTGKSFLLNRGILNATQGAGFSVGKTVSACTKGIWVFPSIVKLEGKSFLVLDTEGLSSLEANANEDNKLLSIALLLCNLFVYNSHGAIDEVSLSQLGTISLLAESLHEEGNSPALVWTLRDFALQLEERLPDEYLEEALSAPDPSKQPLRAQLRRSFPERRLLPFVRPCTKEEDLQNLNSLPDSALRREFVAQLKGFRALLASLHRPRSIGGCEISSRVFVDLCRRLVERVNSGVMPNVEDTFGFVVKAELDRMLRGAETSLQSAAEDLASQLPLDPDTCVSRLRAALEAALADVGALQNQDRALAELRDTTRARLAAAESALERRNEEARQRWVRERLHASTPVDFRRYLSEGTARLGARHLLPTLGLFYDAAIDDIESRSEQVRRRCVEEEETVASLRARAETLQCELGEAPKAARELEKEISCLYGELTENLREQGAAELRSREEVATLRQALTEAESRRRVEAETAGRHDELRLLEEELVKTRSELAHEAAAAESLSKSSVAAWEAQRTVLEEVRAQYTVDVESLKSSAEERRAVETELGLRLAETEQQLSKCRRSEEEFQRGLESARTERRELQEAHARDAQLIAQKGQEQLEMVSAERATLRKSCVDLERRLTRSQVEQEMSKRKAEDQADEIEQLKKTRLLYEDARETLARKQAQADALQSVNGDLQRRALGLEDELRTLQNAFALAKQEQAIKVTRLELQLEASRR